jgi:hypothetical protein
MSAEDDDIEFLKDQLARLNADGCVPEDLGRKAISDLTLIYDEYVAQGELNEIEDRSSRGHFGGIFIRIRHYLISANHVMRYGDFPIPDRFTEVFLAGLERKKRIAECQRRLLTIYRMLNFSKNGACEILTAPTRAYMRAKLQLAVLGPATTAIIYGIWEMGPLPILAYWLSVYAAGVILGWFWRDTYDHAWGRDKLAYRLKEEMPWLILRMPA